MSRFLLPLVLALLSGCGQKGPLFLPAPAVATPVADRAEGGAPAMPVRAAPAGPAEGVPAPVSASASTESESRARATPAAQP